MAFVRRAWVLGVGEDVVQVGGQRGVVPFQCLEYRREGVAEVVVEARPDQVGKLVGDDVGGEGGADPCDPRQRVQAGGADPRGARQRAEAREPAGQGGGGERDGQDGPGPGHPGGHLYHLITVHHGGAGGREASQGVGRRAQVLAATPSQQEAAQALAAEVGPRLSDP